ncbi:hypothetical protein [Variovorax sp. JS1663]|uniref:hypothetical protein n=1 Tax=Variovorax sp. JS1663 TaxID=1851577 RepID=UPI000B3429F3|nr:hypothetical protein [Variovorax sp. JS1663]OUL98523.1 hypothetical protein A8M77_31160 [Variovorax sp. JS1663]
MHPHDPRELLKVWESGVQASHTQRGLLLLGVALPQSDADALARAGIGHRDAWLLTLRETLFGSDVACVLPCPACGEHIELTFGVGDIRAGHAEHGQICEVSAAGSTGRFRLPTSADLLAVEHESDAQAAERLLLTRLWDGPGPMPPTQLPCELADAAAAAMSEADRQADVLLELCCPACNRRNQAPFDIAGYLWRELDRWALDLLQCVHVLASRYGWSEDCILAMSPARRGAYLDLMGRA